MSEINLTDLAPNNFLTGQVGQIVEVNGELKVQPLRFDGQQTVISDPVESFTLKAFNNTSGTEINVLPGQSVIPSGQSMDFYKCVQVIMPTEAQNYATVSGFQWDYNNGTYQAFDTIGGHTAYRKYLSGQQMYFYLCYNSDANRWEIGLTTEGVDVQAYSAANNTNIWYNSADQQVSGVTVTFVNTESSSDQEWIGQKAIFNNGIYTFENNVTSGLSYTSVIPKVGKCYSENALIKANLYRGVPEENFYFLLTDNTESITETSLTNNNVTFSSTYATFNGSDSYLQMPSNIYSRFDNLTSIFFCGWFKLTDSSNESYWLWAVGHGDTDFGVRLTIGSTNEMSMDVRRNDDGQWGPDNSLQTSSFIDNEWHFCAFYSKSEGSQFVCLDTTYQTNTDQNQFYESVSKSAGSIGKRDTNANLKFNGNTAQFRFVFNEQMTRAQFESYCSIYKSEFNLPNS